MLWKHLFHIYVALVMMWGGHVVVATAAAAADITVPINDKVNREKVSGR